MKTKTKSIIIQSTPETVFAYMDNLGNTGMHMTKNSAMMMGTKLKLEQLSPNATGLNAKFNWSGKMMGVNMDFTISVTKWVWGKEKIWETVGEAQMIILKWYRMRLCLSPEANFNKAVLSIDYTKPDNVFLWVISIFLAPLYANWCLNSMLKDSKLNLEK